MDWQGVAWTGKAGLVGQGEAWWGQAWQAWLGEDRPGRARRGPAGHGRQGEATNGMAGQGKSWQAGQQHRHTYAKGAVGVTQVRFNWKELRDIAAVLELLDSQSTDANSQFAGGTLEWWGIECEGWIEWEEDMFWFNPVSNIAAGELDEYKQKHCEQQEEIYRLRRQVEELQGRHQALDEATEQAQELDMGY